MKVATHHHTSRDLAKEKIESILPQLLQEFGPDVSNLSRSWSGDVMAFSFRARGFAIKGKLAVTDTEVVVDVAVPLLARPFEGRLRSGVEQRLAEYLA